jgi:hypothetical protein
MLRPTVCRPACLRIKHHLRLLRVCWFEVHSLTRGQVCRLQLLLAVASAVILGSESLGNRDTILLSQNRESPQPWGPGPHIYNPQEQGESYIPPGTGFLFSSPYGPKGKHSLYCWWSLFIARPPSSRCPTGVCYCNVFTDPLSSNGLPLVHFYSSFLGSV